MRAGQCFDDFVRAHACRPNNRGALQILFLINPDSSFEATRDSRVIKNFDAFGLEALHRMRAQQRMHSAQNATRGFDKNETNRALGNRPKMTRDVVEKKIAQVGQKLDAGVASADDGESEQSAARIFVRDVIGMLAEIEDAFTQ